MRTQGCRSRTINQTDGHGMTPPTDATLIQSFSERIVTCQLPAAGDHRPLVPALLQIRRQGNVVDDEPVYRRLNNALFENGRTGIQSSFEHDRGQDALD